MISEAQKAEMVESMISRSAEGAGFVGHVGFGIGAGGDFDGGTELFLEVFGIAVEILDAR